MNFIHSTPLVISSGKRNYFQIDLSLFSVPFFSPPTPQGLWDLGSLTQGLNTGLAMKALSPNIRTAREFP